VNEQSMLSMRRVLKKAGFASKVWLESPPQHGGENVVIDNMRHFAFHTPPLRWFFEREVFAVARKIR